MSLATRMTLFTLAALAAVLAGFSVSVYLLARSHLYSAADGRLESALDALAAATDVEKDNVEWEPPDQGLSLGNDSGEGQVRWAVFDPGGRIVARSPNSLGADFPPAPAASSIRAPRDLGGWRLAGRRLSAVEVKRKPLKKGEYPSLDLTAGLNLRPIHDALGRLGLTLASLSCLVWLGAAGCARLLCRRALSPLTRMADCAGGVTAETLSARLPDPGTGDELARLCDAFNGVLGRLDGAFERQGRFTAEASHQMRTPLTAMLGQVEVALRRDRPADEYRRVLGVVRDEASRLRQVVESMLFLARAGGSEEPPAERIDLSAWAGAQVARWSAHPRGADLLADCPAAPVFATAHPALLGQLLDNLIENALKYGDPGTPITVRVRAEGGGVVLSVADEGWGLSAHDLARVFEPFFRSDEARRSGQPGAGLGLAVVNRIAEALGGTVSVQSEPGRGTRIALRLPARAATAEPSLA